MLGARDKVRVLIDRPHELAPPGDCAYYADITRYMGGAPVVAMTATSGWSGVG
ncbi:hypothetical protein JQK87_04195 [Streptomyces sp. G44]|uniref:hypothetical protein n=1 Tax=Streptomyces sp. G44 TaxID=2807632 RepID=UPI00196162BF|nr:hypothetical protein [Streptomyces sp. G44]MBM7167618.1 hypothetical protein [Streptomyces sp. G44]